MIIIIKNIPANTSEEDIEEFIKPALKGGWLSRNGAIETVTIKAQKDTHLNVVRFYALVRISPDSVAVRVLKQLNCKRINGRHILVNEYRIRNWHNDPRISRHQLNEELLNKRNADRRRRYIEIDIEDANNLAQVPVEYKPLNM